MYVCSVFLFYFYYLCCLFLPTLVFGGVTYIRRVQNFEIVLYLSCSIAVLHIGTNQALSPAAHGDRPSLRGCGQLERHFRE